MSYRFRWRPYISIATRRQRAAKKIAKLNKSGQETRPVVIQGRKIAKTFWGESWCKNLEAYSDYSNRLPRGRTYARNGSIVDLQVDIGKIHALVSGSSLYKVNIKIKPLGKKRWSLIKSQCAGKIDSMVELLKGSISKGVMEIVTLHGKGLFPTPKEISLSCSCPDWATMCKHVAATLYGVGARLDHEPELLFTLRGVEPAEMIAAAVTEVSKTQKKARRRILKSNEVSSIFGFDVDMGEVSEGQGTATTKRRRRKKASTKKPARKTAAKKISSRSKTIQKSAAAKLSRKKKSLAKKKVSVVSKAKSKKSAKRKVGTKRKSATMSASKKRKKTTAKRGAKKKAITKRTR